MQQTLQITFRGMETSDAVESRIRELAHRLERFCDRITSCHVTLRSPQGHHQHGQSFGVKIRIGVPGDQIVIDNEGSHDPAHEEPYTALRDAFDAAVRCLKTRTSQRAHH
jgi:ribosome-associated translation inhibitor RaiA